ncbi:MAG: DUF4955 domain-containing protein [Puniceicoccaceae bacterium]
MKRALITTWFLIGISLLNAELVEAPSWVNFAESKMNGNMADSVLLDFSYAGYHFSEKPLPDTSTWNTIDVTDHGAVADDEGFDDDAIQAAIDAAEASGVPTVVYFPAGRYKVADEEHASTPIVVNSSNIVLKGAGSGEGGTEIYADQFGNFPWRFTFIPSSVSDSQIDWIRGGISRGSFQIEVSNGRRFGVGQTVEIFQHTTENLELNMPGLDYKDVWRLPNNGIRPYEKHLITHIDGNILTFKNPVNLHFASHSSSVVRRYTTIEEVGVEGILFTSGWINRPEEYGHHDSDLEDYAYRALRFENVYNGWVRDCEFRDWNEIMMIEKSMAVTVKNVICSGKQGHTSYFTRYSYGILFEKCRDIVEMAPTSRHGHAGMIHGPGLRWSTTATVYLDCEMNKHQSIDCHGYHPYGNLLDGVYGGSFRGNGGAENSYPNSGPDLTFWNFAHNSNYSSWTFNFWDTVNRKTHTYPYPKFIGFKNGPGENISFINEGLNELYDQDVYPKSLFDAQLQLRLYGGYMSASSSTDEQPAKLANDRDDSTAWASAGADPGEWLMLDLGVAQPVQSITIREVGEAVGEYRLEYWNESEWLEIETGSEIGIEKVISLTEAVETRKIRLLILGLWDGSDASSYSISTFSVAKDRSDYLASLKVKDVSPNVLKLSWDNHPLQGLHEAFSVEESGNLVDWMPAENGEMVTVGNAAEWSTEEVSAESGRFFRIGTSL